MNTTFEKCFKAVLVAEGGYVNDPNDRGGETKYGISKRAYPNEDIANLTLARAQEIYKRDYWDFLKIDNLPEAIRYQVFDSAVNHGIGNTIRFLQRALSVVDDGVIGPITTRAINNSGVDLIAKFNAERLDFYTKISTWDKFGKGWCRRIASNLRGDH